MGMFFNAFIRHANVVKMANLAQVVNVIAPIFTNENGLFLQPIYFPIAEYGKQKNNQSLDLLVKSPQYLVKTAKLNYLDTSATYDAASGAVYLNVLNRSEKNDIAARIDNATGQMDGAAEVWQMNHTDLKATHTFGDDKKVRPTVRKMNFAVAGNSTNYTFPKHSLTILKFRVTQ